MEKIDIMTCHGLKKRTVENNNILIVKAAVNSGEDLRELDEVLNNDKF